MPNINHKLDSFLEDIKPLLKGRNNAKTTTDITKFMAGKKDITIGSPYSREFRSLKTSINGWLKLLIDMKRIKRKAIPSDTPIDAYTYWID